MLAAAFLALVCVWVGLAHATWFPKMEMTPGDWDQALSKFAPTSSYQSCTNEGKAGGGSKFMSMWKDKPVSVILTGRGKGKMDVKFKDSLYVFEQPIDLTDEYPCLVIPPYQPLEWMMIDAGSSINVCSYSDAVEDGENTQAKNCDCTDVMSASPKCRAVGPPRTIRKPEHEFFLTAELTPRADDVTICTILTVDRLLRLSQMSEFWGGPISAAVYLHELNEVSQVLEWWLSHGSMMRHVDIHLVYDDKIVAFELPDRPFPVNILRNVAIRYARTGSVFYIEGDFIPSPDLYPSLDPVRERLAKGEKSVFIVAPFSTDNNNFDMKLFPKNKEELQDMVSKGTQNMRDLSYFSSHRAFNFGQWFRETNIYPAHFSSGYEPYYIGPKSYPLFEEIFIGCGADKVSHPAELSSAGFAFNVLATGFIVHIDSTGMGSAWCRGWAGDRRSSLKWEAFSLKTGHLYSGRAKLSFDSRIPWWDRAPLGAQITSGRDDEVCLPPPPPEKERAEKECPVCEKCEICAECPSCRTDEPNCGPPTAEECSKYAGVYESRLETAKLNEKMLEDQREKNQKNTEAYEAKIAALKAENERLTEYAKHVTNLTLGGVVVLVVVVGVGACVWPRGKKVWALPTWKPTHHSL